MVANFLLWLNIFIIILLDQKIDHTIFIIRKNEKPKAGIFYLDKKNFQNFDTKKREMICTFKKLNLLIKYPN